MKKPKSLKNIIGIMIMIAAAACFLMSFTVQDQDVRGTGNISIFNANEIQEEYYTVDNLKVLECFGVRIEKSMIDEDLDFGPEYSYHPEDDHPEPGRDGSYEFELRDTYYLVELELLDGMHTAVMSVEDDGPQFEAGETISLCGWVSTMSVTDKPEYTALKTAAQEAHPDAAEEAEFTLYYRADSLESLAEMKAAEHKGDKNFFLISGIVLMVVGALLRDKKHYDEDDIPPLA